MPGRKHVRGVGSKEQRMYEHIKASAKLPPEQEDSGVTLKEDWKSRQNFMPLSHASPCVKVVVPAGRVPELL